MKNLFRAKPSIAQVLEPQFLAGGSLPDIAPHVEQVAERADIDLLGELFAKGLELYPESDDNSHSALDAWLAPRIHYILRLSRRTASDAGVWTWLAMTTGRTYVIHRWFDPTEGLVRRWRYMHNDLLRNAISRLWWGAEMGRNGPSYDTVPAIFGGVRRAQFVLELRYSWYRPAVIAFTNVVARKESGGKPLSDEYTTELSKRLNAYLSMRALEALALPQTEDDDSLDEEWRRHSPSFKEAVSDVDKLVGPHDGVADTSAIEQLELWLKSIVEEIRKSKESTAGAAVE